MSFLFFQVWSFGGSVAGIVIAEKDYDFGLQASYVSDKVFIPSQQRRNNNHVRISMNSLSLLSV